MADNNLQNENQNQYYASQQNVYQANNVPPQEEKASVGFAILSFLIPLAGLIIFIVHKDKRPKTAKASGICALVSFIINIVAVVVMSVSGGLLLGSAVDEVLSDDSSYTQDQSGDNSVEAQGNIVSNNTLGDYGCVVKSAKLCKDYEGKDAVLITYDFTNNSDSATSFDVALIDHLYQDGVGLESAYLSNEETDSFDVQIKPGVTKEVKKAYLLRDPSTSVEVEVAEFMSFSDDKIVTAVELS